MQFSNINQKFNHTLFTGDIRERIKILAESGQVNLAYACAKLHNQTDFVDALEDAIPSISSIKLPTNAKLL